MQEREQDIIHLGEMSTAQAARIKQRINNERLGIVQTKENPRSTNTEQTEKKQKKTS